MFAYDLTGKSVILVLEKDILPYLQGCGIEGSPVFAKVHKMEEMGLWVETTTFSICPTDVPSHEGAAGKDVCKAHIFIPGRAIVSVVAFPEADDPPKIEKDSTLKKIGFRLRKKAAAR